MGTDQIQESPEVVVEQKAQFFRSDWSAPDTLMEQ
jgi:hypothetical protein